MEALVVYYSRTGFTKELAEEIANRIDGDLEPILENKSREGLLGFFKSGWDSFIEKKPEIGQIDKDFSKYDIVIIGTPVWAGNLSAPVRSFIASYRREFNKVAFFCTFGASGSDNAFKNMEILAGRVPENKLSLRKKEVDSKTYPLHVEEFVEDIIDSSNR